MAATSGLSVTTVPAAGAETAARTVVRWWLTGPRAGTRDVLADDPPGTAYHMVTGVREHEGRLRLGSLHEPAIAVVDH
jgi:hypothetical protein